MHSGALGSISVEGEEVGDAVGVVVEGAAVEFVDQGVEAEVGLGELGRHGEGVVEVGQGAAGVEGAGI